MRKTKQEGDSITVTFRLTPDEYQRFREVVAKLQQRETLGRVTSKSALMKGLQLTEKWLAELERAR